MKKALACGLGLVFLTALSPAFAGTVYVLVVDPKGGNGSTHSTELWVSNSGVAQRPFAATFLTAETDGTKRSGNPTQIPVAVGSTYVLSNAGIVGKYGLLEVNTSANVSIEARLTNVSANGSVTTYTPVPVISSANLLPAGETAQLHGLERNASRGDLSNLGVVNLGQQTAQCEVKLFRANGTQIGPTASISLQPLSLRHFKDAVLALGEQRASDARAQVTCNQPFYAFTSLFTGSTGQLVFTSPAHNGASTLTAPGDSGNGGTPSTPGAKVFTQSGLVHIPALGNEAREIKVPIEKPLSLKRMVIEVDFTPGPWNPINLSGNHAIIWVHRGKYRSGTIANTNAFGPGRSVVKNNQNVDLPPGQVTASEQKRAFERGTKYHLRYVYDAQTNVIRVIISSGGVELNNFTMQGTARNGVITLEPSGPDKGLVVQFGHHRGQEGPEIPSYGWRYENLRIEMIQ
ncbi:MAG TPA: hypothetical protein VLQ45_00945 [Thermoanaerobaculia bacterium]|nr:hypothetical protein [Thermoanaerobaculia bacterium]